MRGQSKKLAAAARLWAAGQLEFPGESDEAETETAARQSETLNALAAFGLVPDAPPVREQEQCCLWPELWPALECFLSLSTQWTVGMGGPTGLPYAELRQCVADNSPKGSSRPARRKQGELLALLKAAEAGALKGFADRAEAAKKD